MPPAKPARRGFVVGGVQKPLRMLWDRASLPVGSCKTSPEPQTSFGEKLPPPGTPMTDSKGFGAGLFLISQVEIFIF